jgi:hypothetical protein
MTRFWVKLYERISQFCDIPKQTLLHDIIKTFLEHTSPIKFKAHKFNTY